MYIFHVEVVGSHSVGDGVLSKDMRLLDGISVTLSYEYMNCSTLGIGQTVSSIRDRAHLDYSRAWL